jgi:hypothetical protein
LLAGDDIGAMARGAVTLVLDSETRARIEEVRPENEPLEEWVREAVQRRLREEEAEPIEYVDDCSI